MEVVRDVCLAAVCTLGLAFAAWWLLGRLLRPIPGREGFAVLPGRGDGEGLEQGVRSFLWLRSLGLLNCPVVIADVSLSPEGREVALRAASRWPEVLVWPASSLAELAAFSRENQKP